MYNLDLEKAEEPEIKLPTFTRSQKKQVHSRKTSTSASLTTLKPLTVWITANCGRFLEMGAPDHLTCFLRNLYAGQEAIVTTRQELVPNWERGMSRLHIVTLLIYLIYKIHHVKFWAGWNTSWNQDCWENINNLRYTDDTTLWQKVKKNQRAS